MQFGVLGSLQVIAGDPDEPIAVSAARLRALLAVLLWRANQPVPADELAELVWDGAPPAGAAEATRALVMRLRRRLGERAAARIVTRTPGYAIEISGDELDASRFETLTQDAGAAIRTGRWAQAAQTAAEALGLWRDTPLTDIPSQLLRDRWVPHLDQLRGQALEWRIEGDLHDGHHEQLIPELRDLTARHPLREHFHGQLMLALYRSGRQAEALAAYQGARDALVGELGAEPGSGLRDLHERMLSGDPALAVTGQARPAEAWPTRAMPRELPPAVHGFTGRSAELKALTGLLDRPGGQAPGTVVISAIGGTAGVGKTALAVHWAHQQAGRFPDGQLYVNLRGYDPGPPVPPADALAAFLRSLGVSGPDVPPDEDERAARYRSLLAGKRMLVILDNARSAEQVRPLLPGSPTCTVVVTSRDALAGLVARDGAARLDLDVLPPQDAVALLRVLIGARADAEPEAAAGLAWPVLPAAAGLAGGRRARRQPPRRLAGRPGRRAGRPAHPAGPAGSRRGPAHSGAGRVLLVLPPSGRRGRPGLPAARPAPRPRLRALRRRSPPRRNRAAGPPGAEGAGPRASDPARRTGPVRHARPAPQLRPRTGRQPGDRGGAARGADPPVRPLPAHRRDGDRHPVPRRTSPPSRHPPARDPGPAADRSRDGTGMAG